MTDPISFLQEKKELLNRIFQEKEVIRGADILHPLKEKLPESKAEGVVKLLIAEKCLKHIDKSTNLWDDAFRVNQDRLEQILDEGIELNDDAKLEESLPESSRGIEKEEIKKNARKKGTKVNIKEIDIPCPVITVPPVLSKGITKRKSHISLRDAFRSLIASADEQIKIASPFIDRHGITHYLYDFLEVLEKGVNIQILIRPSGGDGGRGIKYFQDILQKKKDNIVGSVEIRAFHIKKENKQIYSIHGKMVIVDAVLAYVGSGEIRGNSLWSLLETGVIIDAELAEKFDVLFEKAWNKSRLLWKIPKQNRIE